MAPWVPQLRQTAPCISATGKQPHSQSFADRNHHYHRGKRYECLFGRRWSRQRRKTLRTLHPDLDSKGALYFVDWATNRIRKIATDGTISTVAGSGPIIYAGDGGLGPSANIFPVGSPSPVMASIYFNDDGPLGYSGNSRIRKVAPNGVVSTVAGIGTAGFSGDGGPAKSAQIAGTTGVAVDSGAMSISANTEERESAG